MNIKVETERLYLKEFEKNQAQLLIDLNGDFEVVKFTGDPQIKDLEEANRVLNKIILPQYIKGIGRWAVYLKSSNDFIGWCGLKEIDGQYDLGYRFKKEYWGKGYATESSIAVLEYAKKNGYNEIIAQAAKENIASIKVIKKLGFVYLKDHTCGHDPAETYILRYS